MTNILIFQPYLSNRKLSSGTLERQFRFLRKRDAKVFALFEDSEKDYASSLTWITPIIVDTLSKDLFIKIGDLQKQYNFKELYITRTYFTPCTEENKNSLANLKFDENDFRYWRNYVPILMTKIDRQLKVYHMIYDPLELKYNDIIKNEQYQMYSSMNNVENAKCHTFADIGYYDKNKEIRVEDKTLKFTFGATSVEPNRTKMLMQIYNGLIGTPNCMLYLRADNIDTLVPNDVYEYNVSKSLFTYTIPSYNPEHMSFTRMLLALSQGTMPLLHPDNNLDCLFGADFPMRDSLIRFFKLLTMSPDDLEEFLLKDFDELKQYYEMCLFYWHSTEYYNWLQLNAY